MSIQPYHVVYKPYEHLSAMFNLMTVVGTNSFRLYPNLKGVISIWTCYSHEQIRLYPDTRA